MELPGTKADEAALRVAPFAEDVEFVRAEERPSATEGVNALELVTFGNSMDCASSWILADAHIAGASANTVSTLDS